MRFEERRFEVAMEKDTSKQDSARRRELDGPIIGRSVRIGTEGIGPRPS